jgi:hypothetical protein
VFGRRSTPETGRLPRTSQAWLAHWPVQVLGEHPWRAQAKLGLPEPQEPHELRRGHVISRPAGTAASIACAHARVR